MVLFLALLVSAAQAGAQQPTDIRLAGRTVDAETGNPIPGAVVTVEKQGLRAETDSLGRFSFLEVHPGRVVLRVRRIGYIPADTVLTLDGEGRVVRITLRPRPIRLQPLTVHAKRLRPAGAATARALFEREPRTGVVAVSRREIEAIPALATPDVLRSLQALPGVVALNTFSAQLHVRGGGPDQNLFLFDGARVFAPYHLFGIFGAFNTDAVGRVEFYRGALPARYGGALSSVVRIEQRSGPVDGFEFRGGVSFLGVRAMARGELPWAEGQWLFAGRRTHADLIVEELYDADFPYSFYDLQGRVSFRPAPGNRVRASFFASRDRFRLFFEDYSTNTLRTRWQNLVGSLRWGRTLGDGWRSSVTAWGSMYRGRLAIGTPGAGLTATRSRIGVGGLRLEAVRRGEETGLRVGFDLKGGKVALVGSDRPGGYVVGATRSTYLLPAVYVELERWLGSLRLAPGLRIGYETSGGRLFFAPRLAARYYITDDFTLTFGAGRTHQILSTLRDAHYVLPGAPIWFLRPEDAPASVTDALSAELEGWIGRVWNVTVGAYVKRFQNVPRWRPVGTRKLEGLSYNDGRALGLEIMVRKHAGGSRAGSATGSAACG